MVTLLRKLFIKDFQNVNDSKVRQKHGILACVVGIISNVVLVVIKLLIGVIANSLSIISDSLNNVSDVATGSINLVGFKLANKPADKEHPYGHQRIEYIAGLIVALVIVAIAIILGYSSVMKIIQKDNITEYSILTFIILGIAILIKVWQGFFYLKMSKIINSVSLKANSQDSFSDVLSTSTVLVCALIQFFLNKYVESSRPYLYLIDSIAGIVVAAVIIIMGVKLIIETSNPLIGLAPDHELITKIVEDIKSYKGVFGVHDLVAHMYGPTKTFITIHVEVDANVSALTSHELIDQIEIDMRNKYDVELTIHMDPVEKDTPKVKKIRETLDGLIKDHLDESIKYHDLRIVSGENRINVIFDIVVPYKYSKKDDEITTIFKEHLQEIEPKYNPVIKVDRKYV